MRRRVFVLLVLLAMGSMMACGKSGDLYLPDKTVLKEIAE